MQVLRAIAREFSNLDKMDEAAQKVAERLVSLQPAIKKWHDQKIQLVAGGRAEVCGEAGGDFVGCQANLLRFREDWHKYNQCKRWDVKVKETNMTLDAANLKPVLSLGDNRIIEQLTSHVLRIRDWLEAYKNEGKQVGMLARGLKVCCNLKKKATGQDTSFDVLLNTVSALEKTLHDMQVVMQVDLGVEVAKVVSEQERMMKKVDQLLSERSSVGMSREAMRALADHIADVCGMSTEAMMHEMNASNQALWGQMEQHHQEQLAVADGNCERICDRVEAMEQRLMKQILAMKTQRQQHTTRAAPAAALQARHAEQGFSTLPYGWEAQVSNTGQTYYKNIFTGTTQNAFPDWAMIRDAEARKFWRKSFFDADTVEWPLFVRAVAKSYALAPDQVVMMAIV